MLSGRGATDPLRPWRCGGVSCARAPGSLTDVSSPGFARWLPLVLGSAEDSLELEAVES